MSLISEATGAVLKALPIPKKMLFNDELSSRMDPVLMMFVAEAMNFALPAKLNPVTKSELVAKAEQVILPPLGPVR